MGLLYQKRGLRPVILAAVFGVLVAAAPFVLLRNISLSHYLKWLRVIALAGLSGDQFKRVILEELLLVLPVVAALAYVFLRDRASGLAFVKTNSSLLLGLTAGLLVVLAPASKPGAGAHHLVPFVPSLALMLVMAMHAAPGSSNSRPSTSRAALSAGLAFPIMAIAFSLPNHYRYIREERTLDIRTRQLLTEIEEIQTRFPNQSLAVGYGGDEHYSDANVRANPVLQGNPYFIDSVVIMDAQLGGQVIPEATRAAIRDGSVDLWLITAGDVPFSLHTYYQSKAPIFDAAFRDAFRANYSIRYRTLHFDVWGYAGKHKPE